MPFLSNNGQSISIIILHFYHPLLAVIVVVHLSKDSFIFDIWHVLVDDTELFLALSEVSLVHLNI